MSIPISKLPPRMIEQLGLTKPKRRHRHRKGEMNKWEARYGAEILSPRVTAGELIGYSYEAIKLRLADKTWYTPDYCAWDEYERTEVHEVKGHWESRDRVRWKVAAEMYPNILFVAATIIKGQWEFEYYRRTW